MKMKNLAVVVLTTLAFAAPVAHAQAQAQAPAAPAVDQKTAAAVKDMLESMNYRQTLKEMNAQMSAQLPQMIRASAISGIQSAPNLTDEKRKAALADVDAKLPEISRAMQEVMEDPKLIDDMMNAMPALYARHFTTAEIVEIGKFYKTPVGAKTLKVMPLLMTESMQLGQQLVAPRAQAVMQRFAKPAK